MSKNITEYGKVIFGENCGPGRQHRPRPSGRWWNSASGIIAVIRSGSIIYSGARIGRNFRTGHNILIRKIPGSADGVLVGTNSVIENNCRIGNDVSNQTGVYVTTQHHP